MVEKVKGLGPLGLPQHFEEWDREVEWVEESIKMEAAVL
jgi:hypothetical protein